MRPSSLDMHRLEDRLVPNAAVPTLDLTTRESSGSINGAYFAQYDAQPTGTGVIDSFLRVQGASAQSSYQEGHNTDARPLQLNENKSPQFTRSLLGGELPTVNIGGVVYREFLLDINQKSSQPYLSLDRVQLFVGGSGNVLWDKAADTLPGATKVYDLDAGADNWVKLDYRLNNGSGSGDMLMYVPAALLPSGSFVTLYSRFGEHHAGNAGFQEWAHGVGASAITVQTGSISGTVFHDANESGVRDEGDELLKDQIVFIDTNNNGERDDNEAYEITDENGSYTFDELMAGSGVEYNIRYEASGTLDQFTDNPPPIFLAPGEDVFDVDFGVVDRPLS